MTNAYKVGNCMDDYTDMHVAGISKFVEAYRKKFKVEPGSTRLPELSDFAVGEGVNLLYRVVIPYRYWEDELKSDPEAVRTVVAQIERDRSKLGL